MREYCVCESDELKVTPVNAARTHLPVYAKAKGTVNQFAVGYVRVAKNWSDIRRSVSLIFNRRIQMYVNYIAFIARFL